MGQLLQQSGKTPDPGLGSKGFFGRFPKIPPPASGPIFVAAGSDSGGAAFLATRPVGSAVWTRRTATVLTGAIGGIAKAGGVWLAGGNVLANSVSGLGPYALVATNPDPGATWSACGGGPAIALAGGNIQNVVYAADGSHFTDGNGFLGGSAVLAAISGPASGAPGFAACGITSGGGYGFSADGIHWTSSIAPPDTGFSVIWDGTQFVTIGFKSGTGRVIGTSPDGNTYTNNAVSYTSAGFIAWNGTRYCAAGRIDNGVITATTVAGLLTATPTVVATGNFKAICAYLPSGLFCAVDDAGFAYTSTNGTVWTQETPGTGVGGSLLAVAVG